MQMQVNGFGVSFARYTCRLNRKPGFNKPLRERLDIYNHQVFPIFEPLYARSNQLKPQQWGFKPLAIRGLLIFLMKDFRCRR